MYAQAPPTPRDPMDSSLPGSVVCGILQARTLAWAAVPFPREPSRRRDGNQASPASYPGRWTLCHCATWEALKGLSFGDCINQHHAHLPLVTETTCFCAFGNYQVE